MQPNSSTPSDNEREEPPSKPTQEDLDKDFEVFYQANPEDSSTPAHLHLVAAQVSTSQEAANVLEAMVLEEKMLDLLALLTAHAGGDTPISRGTHCTPAANSYPNSHLCRRCPQEEKKKGETNWGLWRRGNTPTHTTTTCKEA